MDESVLAVSAMEGDLMDDIDGEVTDCVVTDGDFKGRIGCIGSCTCCCTCCCGGGG